MSDSELIPSQSEIILEKYFTGRPAPDFNDFDAVLNCVSRMDAVKKLQYRDYQYMINTDDSIEVAPGIYFELVDREQQADPKTGTMQKISYRIYSDDSSIKDLKDYVKKCRQEYESQRNNKLGNETFFFDQITTKDSAKNTALSFDKKRFTTNRTFDNVFFEEKSVVETRVKHFMHNKAWYAKRGIPYTLGFLFHGDPGCGKTSSIKAIANITGRHIINVRLSDVHTNTQLKNLFYNTVVQVINPETGLLEKFVVPTHQRIYVIEDIDCMGDLIKKRGIPIEPIEPIEPVRSVKKVVKKGKNPDPDSDEELEMWRDNALKEEKADMKKEDLEEDQSDRITKDSMFNILDGTLEIPDRMLCITTNFPDEIDEALIRPGRIDLIVNFKKASRQVICDQFNSFYEPEKPFMIDDFDRIRDYKLSPAVVNQVMFKNFFNPKIAIDELVMISSKRKPYSKKAKDLDE